MGLLFAWGQAVSALVVAGVSILALLAQTIAYPCSKRVRLVPKVWA